MKLSIDDDTWVLVLTGAGVSAESGIPTFRDARGLWRTYRFEDVASPEAFERDPALVWRFYGERRRGASACSPNQGHLALRELEARIGERFLLATQNVDGLHRKAKSERLVELHGCLYRTRCASCARPPFEDERAYEPGEFGCEACGGLLRPDIVWFGEALPAEALERIEAFMSEGARHRLIFLAAGTSGAVYPAAGLVDVARARGAETWLVNAEPADNTHRFHHFVEGPSGEVLPRLLG